jgi:hypothetical protein
MKSVFGQALNSRDLSFNNERQKAGKLQNRLEKGKKGLGIALVKEFPECGSQSFPNVGRQRLT